MTAAFAFLSEHPPAAWAAVAGVFLAIEALTGSGWLLWPCAAAGIAALIALTPWAGWMIEAAAFALLTAAFTIAGRRWISSRRAPHSGPDLNDPTALLIGSVGEVTTPFQNGRGRVFVAGKDWAADIDAADDAPAGVSVRVLALLSSSRLKVGRA